MTADQESTPKRQKGEAPTTADALTERIESVKNAIDRHLSELRAGAKESLWVRPARSEVRVPAHDCPSVMGPGCDCACHTEGNGL